MRLGDEHPGSGEPSSVVGSQVAPFTLLHRLGEAMARRASAMPLDAVAHVIAEVAAGLHACHGAGPRAYMSPEQLRGAPVTPAGDVFALGVIAYQLTTGGWSPFPQGESRDAPTDPRERVPGLPAAWADALLAALSPDPARRPASAPAFARSLGDALVRRGPAADIASRYQLGDRLGGGGMAEVFAATMLGAEGFARRVAIKRVLPGLSQVPAFAAMFVTEARIASRLAHPNIVSVLDFARDADDRLCLVMEYVDGKDLASLLATGPIAPSLASYIALEMLRGLGYAHGIADAAARVVHRDVSPQNLLLGFDGAVKVSDFGLAKLRAASGSVRSDVVRGKPSYMSPEQISGEPLDGRADLYAAGVMLWEMLAGRALFAGTAREITAQVLFKDIARPSSLRAGVPADLEAVAMTLLAHDRAARFVTAEAAISALLGCADLPRDGRGDLARLLAERFGGGAARAASPGPVTAAAPPSAIQSSASSVIRFARPRRRVFAATLGMMTLAALAAGLVLARGEIAQSRTAEPAPPVMPVVAAAQVAGARAVSAAPVPVPVIDAGVDRARAGGAGGGDASPGDLRRASPRPVERPAPAARAHRERAARSERTGELAIIVRPWAMIWLNGKPSGQTPFRSAVPVGRYRIRLANDDTGHDEVTTVTVEPDRTATVERTW